MTDAAANATNHRARIEARLGARYRAERRFRAYGVAAIGVAIAALALLLGSIAIQSASAFWTYELELNVYVDPERIADGGRNPETAQRGDYGAMLQEALRAEFPQETESARVRELLGLYT